MEEILKMFDALSDEEKIEVSRAISVKMRDISVPPNDYKIPINDPGTRDIADMPLSRLKKMAGLE